MVKSFVISFFIGLIASALWVVPLINLLYKLRFYFDNPQVGDWNIIFKKITKAKIGTPTLGGILIWLTTSIIWGFYFDNPFARASAFVFFLIGLYGFLEEAFTKYVIHRSKKLRKLYESFNIRMIKLFIMFLLFIIVARVAIGFLGVSHTYFFGLKIPLTSTNPIFAFILLLGLAFVLLTSSYATEMIDGVDGLAAGLYIITLLGYTLLNFAFPTDFLLYKQHYLLELIGVLIGTLIVYLYFNIPPARVFMGSPGALPMGTLFLIFSIYTDTLEAFFFFMLIYLIDLATSAIQLFSMKLRKKRVFPIAPIHHYFQYKGWPDAKVTMRAWLLQAVMVMLGILVQLFVRGVL